MKAKKKICKSCGEERYIWSRKYGCKECSIKKQSQNATTKKSIRKTSEKQQVSNTKVKAAKSTLLATHLAEYNHFFCYSCGNTQGRIDISHLVPIGYNKSLEAQVSNLTFHCENCHQEWEHLTKEIKDFKDFKELLSRVEKLDKSYYNKILSRTE